LAPLSLGTQVFWDGKELHGVRRIKIDLGFDHVNICQLELYCAVELKDLPTKDVVICEQRVVSALLSFYLTPAGQFYLMGDLESSRIALQYQHEMIGYNPNWFNDWRETLWVFCPRAGKLLEPVQAVHQGDARFC
jgi:hypothetical protein